MTHEYTLKDGDILRLYIYEHSWNSVEQKQFAVILDRLGFSLGQLKIRKALSGNRFVKLDTGERVFIESYNYIPFEALSLQVGIDKVQLAESILRTGTENCAFENAGFRSNKKSLWVIDTSLCNIPDCNKIALKPYMTDSKNQREIFDMDDMATLISQGIIRTVNISRRKD